MDSSSIPAESSLIPVDSCGFWWILVESSHSCRNVRGIKKYWPSAQPEDCIDPFCAFSEVVQLNVSTLSNPNSLCISLASLLISNSSLCVSALIDSGSTHCFVDTSFVQYYKLPAYPVDPIKLKLFDRTSNSVIIQSVALPVKFLSSECMNVNFYVTLLDPSCSVVLGYKLLTHYNPLIDWVLGSIIFCPQLLDPSFLN